MLSVRWCGETKEYSFAHGLL